MTLKKIEKLTAKQEKQLVEYREEWLAHGRSTAPADRKKTEEAITKMYEFLSKPPPCFWWCDGPAVGSLVRTVLKINNLRDNLGDNLWGNLRANLRDNLRDNLGDNLRANLRGNLRANLGDNLWDNLRANLGDNLRDNLGDNLGANLGVNLGVNLGANLNWYFWGAHESAWVAFYLWPHITLRKMHKEDQFEKLMWWADICKSCGWWQPFEKVVFVCERPQKQDIDSRGRLHSITGPAMLCRDGWPVYAIHGIRVPADVVESPQGITVQRIDGETNAEVRRIMVERYGFERYIKDAGIKLIQQDDFGKLYRKEVSNEPAMQFVEVVNSTPEEDGTYKKYTLPVRNTVKTAHEAVASSFGLDVNSYNPSFES